MPALEAKPTSLSKKGFIYTAWVVISAPIQDSILEATLKELEMEEQVELVAPGGQDTFYKIYSGKYVSMPQMPSDTAMDTNVVFDWLEVKEEDREESLKCMGQLVSKC